MLLAQAAGSALTSYFAPTDGTSHVYYLGTNNHVEHLDTAAAGG